MVKNRHFMMISRKQLHKHAILLCYTFHGVACNDTPILSLNKTSKRWKALS